MIKYVKISMIWWFVNHDSIGINATDTIYIINDYI